MPKDCARSCSEVLSVKYLLVKQSPKHWKRNVEEEDLQHHFDLSDKQFLQGRKEESETNIKHCWWEEYFQNKHLVMKLADTDNRSQTYVILLLRPVHPVLPLGISATSVPVAVFNGKLRANQTNQKLSWRHGHLKKTPPKKKTTTNLHRCIGKHPSWCFLEARLCSTCHCRRWTPLRWSHHTLLSVGLYIHASIY